MEGDVITLQDIFRAQVPEDGGTRGQLIMPLEPTSLRPGFLTKLKASGVDLSASSWIGAA